MKRLLAALIVFLFVLTAAQAQSITAGPQLGYYKSQDADNASVMIGGALRVKLSSSFGFEGSINYKREKFDDGNVKVTSYPVMATAMIYIIPIVYGAAGAGWYNVRYEYSELYKSDEYGYKDETKQRFGYHLGAGAQLPVGNVVLTGDARYVFLDLKLDNLPSLKSFKSNFYVLTAGILFRL